jgi:predicted HTH domain antitoxin
MNGLCRRCRQPKNSFISVNVISNKISEIGQVELMKFLSLFKKHNLKLKYLKTF